MYEIRHAAERDLPEIFEIYEHARARMKKGGNPDQWKNSRPPAETVILDVKLGRSYVICDEKIAGVFAFITGDDPTYLEIDGAWRGSGKYGVIHRIAADDGRHGVFDAALEFCLKKINDIRIDTHEKNAPMRHILSARGFKYCGIILTDDGTERLAFELIKEDKNG